MAVHLKKQKHAEQLHGESETIKVYCPEPCMKKGLHLPHLGFKMPFILY